MNEQLRAALPAAALMLVGIVVCSLTALIGIQINDEGLMLQAAARIASGEVPYSDFWWYYPPGQPYLLGALWKIFGPSLIEWRAVRVLADATVALLAWQLARRYANPKLALLAWAVALLAMAYPSGPHPFPIALALALGALICFDKRPVFAGILAGLCAAWRLEFAAYLGLGILISYGAAPTPFRRGGAARFLLAAAATAAAAFLPVLLAAGLRTSWDLLIAYPLKDFSAYQGLPLELIYSGPLNTASLAGFFSDSFENLLLFYLPVVLLIGFAGGALALLLSSKGRRDYALAALLIFSLGMAHYLIVRPDVFHTAPLAVCVAVVGAIAIARSAGRAASHGRARSALILAGAVIAGGSLAYSLVEGLDRQLLVLREPTVKLATPTANGVRAAAAVAEPLAAAVADVRSRTAPNAPIYVIGRRADITTSGAPLFYILAERKNPTRYDIAAPGVVTSAAVQAEIVADLERAKPELIVRWLSPLTAAPEPNRAGRSSGVRLLDRYIGANYVESGRYGDWVVLEARAAN
jgi:hypothetical protein